MPALGALWPENESQSEVTTITYGKVEEKVRRWREKVLQLMGQRDGEIGRSAVVESKIAELA